MPKEESPMGDYCLEIFKNTNAEIIIKEGKDKIEYFFPDGTKWREIFTDKVKYFYPTNGKLCKLATKDDIQYFHYENEIPLRITTSQYSTIFSPDTVVEFHDDLIEYSWILDDGSINNLLTTRPEGSAYFEPGEYAPFMTSLSCGCKHFYCSEFVIVEDKDGDYSLRRI